MTNESFGERIKRGTVRGLILFTGLQAFKYISNANSTPEEHNPKNKTEIKVNNNQAVTDSAATVHLTGEQLLAMDIKKTIAKDSAELVGLNEELKTDKEFLKKALKFDEKDTATITATKEAIYDLNQKIDRRTQEIKNIQKPVKVNATILGK